MSDAEIRLDVIEAILIEMARSDSGARAAFNRAVDGLIQQADGCVQGHPRDVATWANYLAMGVDAPALSEIEAQYRRKQMVERTAYYARKAGSDGGNDQA